MAILLLGFFGATYSGKFLSIMISLQLIIVSAVINFFAFSLFLYNLSNLDKVFVFFALITLYLFNFLIIFFNYTKQTNLYDIDVLQEIRLFKLSKSDWWGEDKD
jgi:hypothetical protein